MIVKGLIPNVNSDAELTALTGMDNNSFAYHTVNLCPYIYEVKLKVGDIESDDGGYWVKESLSALTLDEYKNVRYKEIDNRTFELIEQGFTYQSLVFSLSQNAQINILGLDHTKNDPAIIYPIEYSAIDDSDHYYVQDATDLHGMYLTALGTKKAYVDSGTLLKDAVRDAVDDAEVQ